MTTPTTTELVPFRGAAIEALMHDNRPWAVLRSICGNLGINPDSQRKRLASKDRAPWATTAMMTAVAADGKAREVFCLDVDTLPMWLATIEVSRVKPEARDSLVAYQREAARVLRDHFLGRAQAPLVAVASQPQGLQLTAEELAAAAEHVAGAVERQMEGLRAELLREVRAQIPAAPDKLYTAKQMCDYLQVPLRRWREMYLSGRLDGAQVSLGDGEDELRWDPAGVLRLLRVKP